MRADADEFALNMALIQATMMTTGQLIPIDRLMTVVDGRKKTC